MYKKKIQEKRKKIEEKIKKSSERIKVESIKIRDKSKKIERNIRYKIIEHRVFLSIVIILLLTLLYNYIQKGFIYNLINSDTESIVSLLRSSGKFAILVFFIITIFEVIFAPLPSIVLFSAAGVVFGGFLGGLIGLIGNLVGSIIAFLIARRYGRHIFEKIINEKQLARFDKYSEKYGAFALFILRLNPFTSTDVFSYLSGFTNMKLTHFIIATLFGLAPLSFAQSYLGNRFIENSEAFLAISFVVTILYLMLFLYGIYLGRKANRTLSSE